MEVKDVIIYRSKTRIFLPLALCVFVILVSYFSLNIFTDTSAKLASIAGLIFFSFAFFLGLREAILIKRPVIILNESGVEDKRLGCGPILWSEINSIGIYQPSNALIGRRSLLIQVKNFYFYLKKLSLYYRIFYGLGTLVKFKYFVLDFTGLEDKFDIAYRYAQEKLGHHK